MKAWLFYSLWASSPVSQLVIAAIMFRRSLHREFPVFFSYTLFRATTALLILFLSRLGLLTDPQFFGAEWLHETGCILLRFIVIYELFRVISKAYSDLSTASIELFRWSTAVLVLVSVMLSFALRGNPPNGWIDAGLNVLDRTVDFVQVGLLLIMLLLVQYLQLSGRSYAFGIAVGLGIFAAVDLITSAVLAQSGAISIDQQKHLTGIVDLISLGAYQACAFIWLFYALLPERMTKTVTTIPEHELDAWDHELQRLVRK
jgi:hypothetical protein